METAITKLTTASFNYGQAQQAEAEAAFQQIANISRQTADVGREVQKAGEQYTHDFVNALGAGAKGVKDGFDDFIGGLKSDASAFEKDIKDATENIGNEFKDTLKNGILKGEWKAPDVGGILQNLGDSLFDKMIDNAFGELFTFLGNDVLGGIGDFLMEGIGGLFGNSGGSGGGGGNLLGGLDGLFGGGSGGGGIGSIIGGLFGLGFAKGGVFERGEVIPFAKGGVVGSAALFPLGMMGEAGPEAIMPLKRLSSGELGVRASGATQANSVVIHNHIDARGGNDTIEQRIRAVLREEEPRLIRKAAQAGADEAVQRSTGGGSYARAMGR